MIIFLDMDGVLVDFVRGAAELFNENYDTLIANWPKGQFAMEKVLGLSEDQFAQRLEEGGSDFWANLPAYDYADELFDFCCSLGETYILTAPTSDPGCLNGKMYWLYNKFGHGFKDYIMTPFKGMCADTDRVLIDDHEKHVADFRSYGGHSILWPTLFNKRHEEAACCLDVVKRELYNARPFENGDLCTATQGSCWEN